ncbi:AraC family transcriptional regulator [Cytophagaceae bacterium ABcell3]|nr:AraC family transcriptional regulator [Cytophagaceae bacterium ABcell3]
MKKNILLLLLPLFIIAIAWAITYREPVSILEFSNLETAAFSDQDTDGGKSQVLATEDSVNFKSVRFNLQEGFISPYAGVSFFRPDNYWDLSGYDNIKLDLEIENIRNLELTISTYQNGVTKENEPLSFRHNILEIPISDNFQSYTLAIDRMAIAQWWLERFKLRSAELGHADLSKTRSFSFTGKIKLDQHKDQVIRINGITFSKDMKWFYLWSGGFLLFWFSGLLVYFKFLPKKQVANPSIHYKPTEGKVLKRSGELDAALEYLAAQYPDPALSLQGVSATLKIPEKIISAEIKKRFNLSFKEYLNTIRITEAKRLLHLEALHISEVAYRVGFSNPSHFNRVFKSLEACTPSEFRGRVVTEKAQ